MTKIFKISPLPVSKLFVCFEKVPRFSEPFLNLKIKNFVIKDEIILQKTNQTKSRIKPKIRNYTEKFK